MSAYEEIIDFIASGPSTSAVAAFQATPEQKARIADLLRREKDGSLSTEEKSELDHFAELEHLMRLAKARARERLACG
jgi:hypothetical protein